MENADFDSDGDFMYFMREERIENRVYRDSD